MTDIKQKAREVRKQVLNELADIIERGKPDAQEIADKVQDTIAAAIQSAVADEREACAKIAMIPNGCACGRGSLYEGPAYCHLSTAAAIRARAQAKEKP